MQPLSWMAISIAKILYLRKKRRMDISKQLAGAAIVKFGELEVFET